MRPSLLVALAALLPLAAAQPARAQPAAASAPRPTLVVLVTVDQLRADYLDRFAPRLQGGLARLAAGGARFTNAHHDHAIPETAPGHATLLSGRFPRGTGIVFNDAGVDDPASPLLDGAPGSGASPARFRGTTLVDWMRARDRRTRALSVSGKDRSAILPFGRAKEHVYWYAADGRFTTSRYYRDALPEWVTRFNARRLPHARAGQAWTLLHPDGDYLAPDSVSIEGAGHDVVFPHVAPTDTALAVRWVTRTPWIDEIVLALALHGVRELSLGTGPQPDLLNVSLSATDAIGHAYGPDSREIEDQVLRLDQALGAFLDSLFRLRDSTRVAIVLTADHGVTSIPEIQAGRDPPPMRVDLAPLTEIVRAGLQRAGADTNAFALFDGLVVLDRAALARARVNVDSLLTVVDTFARGMPGVLRVDRFRDLLAADHARDPVARRWSHQFPPTVPIELVITLAPGNVWWTSNVAVHLSPHDADTHVPLLFHGPAFRRGTHAEFVRSVDIAPTLAALLGLRPAEPLDGVVLKAALP